MLPTVGHRVEQIGEVGADSRTGTVSDMLEVYLPVCAREGWVLRTSNRSTASALLVATGDNPERLRAEGSFAHLCGVAPSVCLCVSILPTLRVTSAAEALTREVVREVAQRSSKPTDMVLR